MRMKTLLLTLVLLTTAVPAAVAHHNCYEETVIDRRSGEVTKRQVCPSHDAEPDVSPPGDDGPPTGDTGGNTPATPVGDRPPARQCQDVGAHIPGGVGDLAMQTRPDGSTWEQRIQRCDDGGVLSTELYWRCSTNCPADPPAGGGGGPPVVTYRSVDELRLEALGRVNPTLPTIRHSFDQPAVTGVVRAIVLAEQWWWMESAPAPVTVRAEDGPVWVEVTATPGEMVIDPGDGSGPLSCEPPGVAYDIDVSYYDQVPGEPKGACVHVYEQTSEAMTATLSMSWDGTWEAFSPAGGASNGTLGPIVRSESVTFPVGEIQSVISASN